MSPIDVNNTDWRATAVRKQVQRKNGARRTEVPTAQGIRDGGIQQHPAANSDIFEE